LQLAINELELNANTEITDRTTADTTLQTNINTEKSRIDAILVGTDDDKKTFSEIKTYINVQDNGLNSKIGTLTDINLTNSDDKTSVVTAMNKVISMQDTKLDEEDIPPIIIAYTGILTNLTTDDQNSLVTAINEVASEANHTHPYLSTDGGTITGDVTVNGAFSATSVTETSSIRFKENVKPIEFAFNTISKLQGVSYNWKESGKNDIGFIAEEVEKVLPQLIKKSKEGVVEGMNYSRLTALLVEVVKDQQKQIDELKQLLK